MRNALFIYKFLCFLTLSVLTLSAANAGQTYVAVAANFTPVAKEIADTFQKETGHRAILSFGSTGKLFTQIIHGAPFEVFLSADQKHTGLVVEKGFATPENNFTYATGHLVLYSADERLIDNNARVLKAASFRKIATANPKTSPYGKAAHEVLKNLNLLNSLQSKIVRGDNIAQTYQFVATGNAELGFVALSQIIQHDEGSRWIIPTDLYAPLKQDALLLKRSGNNGAAMAFYAFLKNSAATAIIERYGYTLSKF